MSPSRYEEIRAAHSWQVPARYNIAHDVCDKHPRDKPALVSESFDGSERELVWASAGLANRGAHARARRRAGDRVASCSADTEAPRSSSASGSSGRSSLHVGALRGRAIEHRLATRARSCSSPTGERAAVRRPRAPAARPRDDTLAAAPVDHICADTAPTTRAALLTSGRPARPRARPRAPVPARTQEFEYCHEVQDGERFHGMGEWAWAAGHPPLLGPWRSARCSASTGARAASTRTGSSTSSAAAR